MARSASRFEWVKRRGWSCCRRWKCKWSVDCSWVPHSRTHSRAFALAISANQATSDGPRGSQFAA